MKRNKMVYDEKKDDSLGKIKLEMNEKILI